MERLPDDNPDQLGVPDSVFMRPTVIAIFDNVEDSIVLVTPAFPSPGIDARAAYADAERRLGQVLSALERPLALPHAEAVAKQVLRVDPSNYLANLRLAYALRLQKKFDAAEQLLGAMLVLYPTDVSLLTEFALIKLAKDNKADAKRLFNDVIVLDPENITAKAQLSKL